MTYRRIPLLTGTVLPPMSETEEAAKMREYMDLTAEVIRVDDFPSTQQVEEISA